MSAAEAFAPGPLGRRARKLVGAARTSDLIQDLCDKVDGMDAKLDLVLNQLQMVVDAVRTSD